MPFEFKFPFAPPWEDLKVEIDLPGGGKAYVFDTCVERDPKKVAEIEREIGLVLARAQRRKFLQELSEAQPAGA